MEQWLAQANRGYSVSSYQKTGIARSVVASNRPTPGVEAPKTWSSESDGSVRENRPQVNEPIQVATVRAETPPERLKTNSRLLDESHLRDRNKELPWNDKQFQARLSRGRNILAQKKTVPPPRSSSSSTAQRLPPNFVTTRNNERQVTTRNNNRTKLLDLGSQAKATLVEGIAWTGARISNRKYILYLESDFKNSGGLEVLPKGTRLIAKISEVSSAGLFFMEITHIVKSFDEPKIPVPQGTLEIVSKDGSPLKAEVKQKGSSDFWTSAAAIIAPGIERALDDADSLLVDNDSYSVVSRNDNPLTSGLSGVAEGASDVLSDRMRNRSNRNSVVPYFQFDGDQTVRIRVNEDFLLP